jgi:hypothetical protein
MSTLSSVRRSLTSAFTSDPNSLNSDRNSANPLRSAMATLIKVPTDTQVSSGNAITPSFCVDGSDGATPPACEPMGDRAPVEAAVSLSDL